MPIHGYICVNCDERYEVFYTSISKVEVEEPTERCPRCQSTEKERLVSTGTTFKVNTSGFHSDTPARQSKKSE